MLPVISTNKNHLWEKLFLQTKISLWEQLRCHRVTRLPHFVHWVSKDREVGDEGILHMIEEKNIGDKHDVFIFSADVE